MKMLIAIVNNDDAFTVNSNLSKAGFPATKIASTGGFLMNGNSTFLIGVNDDDVEKVISLIAAYSKKRVQPAPSDALLAANMSNSVSEVTVGGATIFIMNVESCRRV